MPSEPCLTTLDLNLCALLISWISKKNGNKIPELDAYVYDQMARTGLMFGTFAPLSRGSVR